MSTLEPKESKNRQPTSLYQRGDRNMNTKLFDDKSRHHRGAPLAAESTYSFYNRSSLEEYHRLRQMLQRWVDRLPPEHGRKMVTRMRHKGPGSPAENSHFFGAFLELFMHEFLQGTGAAVVVEPESGGRTPDFGVTEDLHDGSQFQYVVEATDIKIEGNSELELPWLVRQVSDILNEIESPDFFMWVETDGTLESMPRKESLKQPFLQLLREADYDELSAFTDHGQPLLGDYPSATFVHGNWTLRGSLFPVGPDQRGEPGKFVGAGLGTSASLDDIEGPRRQLYKKARRYRDVEDLIIAIRTDPTGIRMRDVLFGTQNITVHFPKDPLDTRPMPEPQAGHKLDGFWVNSKGPQNTNVIGVVVFQYLHPHCIDQTTAVYYSNPYVDRPKPTWADAITHAEYPDNRVTIVEGLAPSTYINDYEVINNQFE